jgi:hypothetical protein
VQSLVVISFFKARRNIHSDIDFYDNSIVSCLKLQFWSFMEIATLWGRYRYATVYKCTISIATVWSTNLFYHRGHTGIDRLILHIIPLQSLEQDSVTKSKLYLKKIILNNERKKCLSRQLSTVINICTALLTRSIKFWEFTMNYLTQR